MKVLKNLFKNEVNPIHWFGHTFKTLTQILQVQLAFLY